MYILRNLLKLIFVYCPIIILIIGLGFYTQKQFNNILTNIAPITSAIATEYMEAEAHVDSIEFKGLSIILNNLYLKEPNGKDFASAEKVSVRINPLTITARTFSILNIKADNCYINIERKNGKQNFDFLTKLAQRKNITPTDIRGPIVLITNSRADISDDQTGYIDHLTNINIRFDLRSKEHPSVSATLSSDYIQKIKYSTNFDISNHRALINLELSKINLSVYNKYSHLIPVNDTLKNVHITNVYGISDAKIYLNVQNMQVKDYLIKTQFSSLYATTNFGSVSNANLRADLTPSLVTFNTQGNFGSNISGKVVSSNLSAKGNMGLSAPYRINSILTLKNANLSNFSSFLPKNTSLSGVCDITANLSGDLKNPILSLGVKGKDLAYEGVKLSELSLKASYKDKVIDYEVNATGPSVNKSKIISLNKNWLGTTVKIFARGDIKGLNLQKPDIKSLTTTSLVNLRGFDISSLCPYKGLAEGDFLIKGNITRPKITSNMSLSKGVFDLNKIKYENISIDLSFNTEDQKAVIKNGLIKGLYNTAIIFRGYLDSKLNAHAFLSIDSLDLAPIGKDFDTDLKGLVNFNTEIIKTGNIIEATNRLNGSNIQYKDQYLDFIQADFSLTPYALYIHNCNILYLPATVQFAGIISPNQNFLESVISEASDLKIVKDTQEFDIEKELKNLNKDSQNISILSMFKAKKPNIYFAGKLKGNNFSTKHLSERLKIKNTDIKAIANCNMYIGGVYIDNKIKDLSGEGDITIDNLMAYENIFNNLTSKVNVNDNIITLSDLKGDAVSYNATDTNRFGTIDGECTYNITTGEILGDLNINNLNINDFRKYYKNYLNAFGITNTKCHFYGTVNKEINDINCNIDTEIPILSVNGKSYRDISLTASLLHSDLFSANGIIKKDDQYLNILVDNLSIKNENVENISVTVQKASVNDLREIFYLSPLAKTKSMKEFLSYLPIISNGTIDLNMTASGNLNSLNGECEINGEDINADFDKLSVFYAKLTAEEGVVNLENLDIEGTEFVLACDAYPLLDIHNAFKPKSETKLAKASLVNNSNINISITNLPLERFGKYINMEDVKGMLACDALITGDLSQPNITASVNVDEPAIGSIQMDNLIASKIDITKDTIDLTEGITLYMTEDNYATLKGTIPMSFINTNNSKDNINLSLEAPEQDLGFLEVLTPLIDKDTSKGTFALTATLAGPISDTTLSGGATISEGEIHTIGHTTLTNINSQITFDNDDAGNLLLNIDKLTLNDNNNKEYAFVADPGYIKIKSKNNILSERINNQNRQQNKNITIGDMLSDGEIYLHGTFDDFYYTNSDFSSFSDKTNCYVNGKIFVEGNLLTPKIYSPETCVLNKVKFSCKAGKNEKSEDDSLLTLANNKIQTTGIYTYNDAVVYDEIFTQLRERRNKKYLFNPSFDISVKAENIEARPPATIAKVDLDATVTGNLNNPTVKGRAVIKEGRSSFQIARARIVKGSSVDFEYSDHTPKADINIEAFSFVHASDKSGNDERYKINIAVKGGLDDYEIKMESDPEGLSQQEILEAFTGINKNTINAGDTLAKIGANNILTPIEDFFVEYLGFDSLGFEYQQNKYAIINIERSFNKKFYASFYSNLYNGENTEKSNISEWELKFGYKFNNRLRMNIGTTDTKERTITFTYGFKF